MDLPLRTVLATLLAAVLVLGPTTLQPRVGKKAKYEDWSTCSTDQAIGTHQCHGLFIRLRLWRSLPTPTYFMLSRASLVRFPNPQLENLTSASRRSYLHPFVLCSLNTHTSNFSFSRCLSCQLVGRAKHVLNWMN